MKKWNGLLPNSAIILILSLLIVFNFIASYYQLVFASKVASLFIIPLLLVNYFYRQAFMANVFYTIFLLYFLGMIFNTLDPTRLVIILSEAFYLIVYSLLAIVLIGRLKKMKFEGVIVFYLVLSFLALSFFTYGLIGTIREEFTESIILTLSLVKGIVLWIIGFMAFAIYLSKESSQSITFLTLIWCFIFSDLLQFISSMYVYYWAFEGMQKVFQGGGLLLLCIYVYNCQRKTQEFKGLKIVSRSNESTSTFQQISLQH